VYPIGDRVLVVGGTTAPPCPPNASCLLPKVVPLRDGSVFDATAGTWNRIANAPVPLGDMSGVVLGRILYLWLETDRPETGQEPAFLAYHLDGDRWEKLPRPNANESLRLVATSDRVIAYQGTQERGVRPDAAFDPRKRQWSKLPADPLILSFDRGMVWTGRELFLFGIENVPNPGSEKPSLYRVAVYDESTSRWRRLPDSEVAGFGPDWFWSAEKIVNPWVGIVDGGEVNNWGRTYPFGGIYDPGSRRWSSLPPEPAEGTYNGPTVGGSRLVATRGRVLDVAERTWTILDAPPYRPDGGESAAWLNDGLVVWGGYRDYLHRARFLNEGWIWRASD
jgi:hypothetical protein